MSKYLMVKKAEKDVDIAEVVERLTEHPKEWAAYGDSLNGLSQIVGLEYAQFQVAKTDNDRQAMKDEATELAAACINLIKHM
jgi:hypothetical protein